MCLCVVLFDICVNIFAINAIQGFTFELYFCLIGSHPRLRLSTYEYVVEKMCLFVNFLPKIVLFSIL